MNTHPTTTFGIWAFILAVFVLIAFLPSPSGPKKWKA